MSTTAVAEPTLTKALDDRSLSEIDPAIHAVLEDEKQRQSTHIELIASKTSHCLPLSRPQAVCLPTNTRRAILPNATMAGASMWMWQKAWPSSGQKSLFGAEYANVQPHSGSQANTAVYFAMLQPGDKILTMSLQDGGHLTHGHPKNCSGMLYNVVNYGVNPETGYIDYDEIERLAVAEKPKLITVGASAYPRTIDFERMGGIAKANGALLLADIAHIAGLVAAGLHPSPFRMLIL